MSYEQWDIAYKIAIVVGVLACAPAGLFFYHFTRRRPDQSGKRKGRPILSVLVAMLALVGPGLVPYLAFPEQAAEYRERSAQQEAVLEGRERQNRSESRSQCLLWCDAVEECRGLARDQRGRVTDAAGLTACNRASSACTARCYERYPSIDTDR